MSEKTVDINASILSRNGRLAARLRERFAATGTYVVNVLSSPGSGKTSTILATSERLREGYGLRCAVIEGDIASDVDAQRVKAAGMPAIQINTGGLCHLEGNMIEQAIDAFEAGVGLDAIDVIFIENVGNLVCPVDFDLGENLSVMILSVPEGDDKPLKYPGIFQHAGVLLLNKVDVAAAFDFDMEGYGRVLDDLNPTAARFSVSATKGDGLDAWVAWLADRIAASRAETAPSPESHPRTRVRRSELPAQRCRNQRLRRNSHQTCWHGGLLGPMLVLSISIELTRRTGRATGRR